MTQTEQDGNRAEAPQSQLDDMPPPVLIHPPLLGVLALVAVGLLEWFVPLPGFREALPAVPAAVFGALIGLSGLGLLLAAASVMLKGGTNIPTFQPALAVVEGGIYARTRNPMYLGVVLGMIGLGLLAKSLWLLLSVIPVWLVLHYAVVLREEAYMAARFGAAYTRYRDATPRWF
jgi:protein-S-isoprenylcysteine O-methyltransferase Ste14